MLKRELKGESVMYPILMREVLKNFKREARFILKRLEVEDRYSKIEPYFEEAINQLPEESKDVFYLRFNANLNELEIANALDLSLSDAVKELKGSIIFALSRSEELYLEDLDRNE